MTRCASRRTRPALRVLALAISLPGFACRPASPTTEGAADAAVAADSHGHDGEHDMLPTVVRLPEKVLVASGIKTEVARLAVLAPTIDLTGEVTADQDATAALVSAVPGRVVEVFAREGAVLAAGAVFAVIDSPELARARAALTSATARAEAARKSVARLGSLGAAGFASAQERSAAEAEASVAAAEEAAARQVLSAFGVSGDGGAMPSRYALRAPLGGTLLGRSVVVGQHVTAEQELGRLTDLGRAYFTARLFERSLGDVAVGARADVRLNAYPGVVFPGRIEAVSGQLDPVARTVVARVALRSPRGVLRIGLFGAARVELPGGRGGEKRLVVPNEAVSRVAGKDVVFVRHPDGDYEVHPVTLGDSGGGLVEVLEGLHPGEAVVVDGVFTLKSLVLKRTFGEEE